MEKKELTEYFESVPESSETVKYYLTRPTKLDPQKFKYSLVDIQMENISEGIKDDYIRDAIINPTILEEKYEEEKQALLYDLALLENTSECREIFPPSNIANQ